MRPEVLKYLLTGQQSGNSEVGDAIRRTNETPYLTGLHPEGLTTDPSLVQDSWSGTNTMDSFLNSLARVGVGSNQTKLRNIDYAFRKHDEDLYSIQEKIQQAEANGDTYNAELYKLEYESKLKEKRQYELDTAGEVEELKNDIANGSGITGMIAGGQKDINNRKISLDYQLISNMFQQDAGTSPYNAFKYEFGTDFGSSFGTLGTTIASAFTPKLLRAAAARLAASETVGSVAPGVGNLIAGGLTLATIAADVALQYQARLQETGAEENDAYEQAVQELTSKYIAENNIQTEEELQDPIHQRALNKIHMRAHEELDGLRTKNMGLMFGDAMQSLLAVTPYTRFANKLVGTNRWSRTALKMGAMTVGIQSEMNEEGSQWLFTQQYLDKVMGRKGKSYEDTTDYSQEGLQGLLSTSAQLLDDRYRVEKAMFGSGDSNLYMNEEFRSSVNAGAFAAGPMMAVPQAVGIFADFYGFAKAKSYLGRAAKEQTNGEYLRFKYDTYERFLDNDKEDYFIENIRNLATIENSGITKEQAEKEVARFKRAKAEFDKIDDTQYIGGIIEKYDLRGISKKDRKQAIKNSLMISELTEQIADILSLRDDSINPYRALMNDPNEKDTSKADLLKKRKQLFEALLDPEKAKSFNFEGVYDDMDIPIILKERAMAKLLKENERIASGEYTRTERANNKIANSGTQAQRNGLSYKYGNKYVNNPNMVGMDNQVKGEQEYIEFLEDLEATSLLRDNDKRSNVQRMLDLEMSPREILAFAEQANAPLTKEQHAELGNRLATYANKFLADASEVVDSDGNKHDITTLEELETEMEYSLVEDPKYYESLKALHDQYKTTQVLQDRLNNDGSKLIRDPEAIKTTAVDKQVTFVKDRFLNEMFAEVEKALTESDYIDDQNINVLEKKLKWLKDVLIEERQLYVNPDPKISKDLKNSIEQLERDLAEAKKVIRARLADKELEQVEAYNRSTEDALMVIGAEYTPSTNKDDVVKINIDLPQDIKDIIVNFLKQFAVQDATGKWYIHHSYAMASIEYLHSIEDLKFLDRSREYKHKLVNDLYLYCKTKYEALNLYNGAPFSLTSTDAFKDPETFVTQFLLATYRGAFNDVNHTVTKYINTKDVSLILKGGDDLGNSFDQTPIENQVSDIKSLFRLLRTIKAVGGSLNSPLINTKDTLQKEINLYSSLTEFLPTKQQLVSLRELASWYKGDILTSDSAVLLGYAGSGKTQVVTKFLISLLNLDKNNIISFAPTPSANKNLAKALGKDEPTSTDPVKEFLDMSEETASKASLIIIDEAGLLNDEQVTAINEKMLRLQVHADGPKVIFMGDPTQLSDLNVPAFIGKPLGEYPTRTFISPLTVTYRTDDIDIIRTQKEYRSKTERVTSVRTAATSNRQDGSVGVNNKQDLYNILQTNNKLNRQQLVIVNDETAVEETKKELAALGLTNVQVLTIRESQSHTVDEVYVMLTPTGNLTPEDGLFNRFNTAMYVATSRARNLVVIHSTETKFTNDTKALLPSDVRKPLDQDTKDAFIQELQDQLDNITNSELNSKLKAVEVTAVNPTTINNNDPDPAPTDDPNDPLPNDDVDQDNSTVDEVKEEQNKPEDFPIDTDGTNTPVEFNGEVHDLKFPQYSTIKDRGKKILPGSKVNYVKYWDKANNRAGLAIIAQAQDGAWYLVGVVGKDDINETGRFKLPKKVADAINSADFQTRDANDIEWSEFGKDGKLNADLEDKNLPLLQGNVKSATPKFFKWSNSLMKLSDFIQDKFAKIIHKYYQDSANLGQFDEEQLKSNWEVVIYNNNDIVKNNLNPRVIRPGVPYQMFKIKHSGKREEIIHIPLNTRKYNNNVDADLQPLKNLLIAVKDVHKYLDLLDGDIKIRWGGKESIPGYSYKHHKTGQEVERTQAEVFVKLLNLNSDVAKEVTTKLGEKGVNLNEFKDAVKNLRDLFYSPLPLKDYGYDPTGPTINGDGRDAEFLNKYFITGDKGSRKIIEGNLTVGKNKYTPHPTLSGFYLIEKGTKGYVHQVWRKVYNYKGIQIKIDLPVGEDAKKIKLPTFELHNQELMDSEFDGKRNFNLIRKGGTKIESGIIYNQEMDPTQYVEELINDNLISERGNKGPAEKAFDSLARANSSVFVGDKKVFIRQTRYEVKDGVPTGHKFFTGLNLLYTPGHGNTLKYIHTHRISNESPENKVLLVEPDPITVDVLEAMVGAGSFDTNGESTANGGFGLRIPMHSKTVQRRTNETETEYKFRLQSEIANDLETSWDGLESTRIEIGNIEEYTKTVPSTVETPSGTEPIAEAEPEEDPFAAKTSFGHTLLQDDDFDEDDADWRVSNTNTPSVKSWVTPQLVRKAAAKIFGEKFASDPDNIVFLTRSEMIRRFGKDLWGRYMKGVLYLVTDSEGNASTEVLRHEAFHRVMKAYFTKDQRKGIYALAVDINSSLRSKSLYDIEEWLADQFMIYNRNSNMVSRLLHKFFRKIKEIFNFQLSSKDLIEAFFDRIDAGNFTWEQTNIPLESIPADKLRLAEWFGTKEKDGKDYADNFLLAQTAILKSVASKIWPKVPKNNPGNGVVVNIKNRNGVVYYNGVPMRPDEARVAVYNDLRDQFLQMQDKSPMWLKIIVGWTTPAEQKKSNKIFNELYTYLVQEDKLVFNSLEEDKFGDDPSLKDEIEESWRINYEGQLLQSVKNRMSSLFVTQYNDEGEPILKEYIPRRAVFYIALKLLKGVTNFDSSAEQAISLNATALGYSEDGGDPKIGTVYNFLIDILRRSTADKYTSSVTETERNGQKRKVYKLAFLPSNLSIKQAGYKDGGVYLNGKLLTGTVKGVEYEFTRRDKSGNKDLNSNLYIARMVSMLKSLDTPVTFIVEGKEVKSDSFSEQQLANMLATLLMKNEALNLASGIQAGMISLVERNPYMGLTDIIFENDEVEGDSVTIKPRYIPNTLLGGEQAIKLSIEDSLMTLLREGENGIYKLRSAQNVLNKAKSTTTKDQATYDRDVVGSVFLLLGLGKFKIFNLTPSQNRIIINALDGIVNSVMSAVSKTNNLDSIEEIITDENTNRIKEIMDTIAISQGFGENSRYLDANNRSSYKFVKGSYLTNTFATFRRYLDEKSKGNLTAFKLPEHLESNSLGYQFFFKYNPFLSKNGRAIRKIITQEALKQRYKNAGLYKESERATPYKNEGINGWSVRQIVFAFYSTMTKSDKKPTYIQTLYTPSNKPQNFSFEIPASDMTTLRTDIKVALQQQAARYTWYEKLATSSIDSNGNTIPGVFVSGVPLTVNVNQDGTTSLVWTGKLKGGFSKYIDRTVPTGDQLEKLVDKIISDMDNDAFEYYDFLMTNSALQAQVKGMGSLPYFDANRSLSFVNYLTRVGLLNEAKIEKLTELFDKKTGLDPKSENYKTNLNTFIIISEAYKQNFVNGHFLNQFQMSDRSLYKNPTTQIKRASGPISPADTGRVDTDKTGHGLPETYKIIVGDDESSVFNVWTDVAKAYKGLYGITIDRTDGQMYYTPKWRKKLEEGFSDEYSIANVIKPVLYFIDKFGVTRFSKNSGIELTDALCNMFPELKELRDEMDKNDIKEFHSNSAFKVGAPARIVGNNETITSHLETSFGKPGNGIIEVPSMYYGIQSNPIHAEGEVTNFSQLTYFLNINKENQEATQGVYEIDALIMSSNFDKYLKKLGSYIGDKFVVNEDKVRKTLAESIGDMAGYERFEELITAKDGKGNYLIDLNFPALRNRVEISLMSGAANKSVKSITGTGSKLVLQSAKGVSVYRIGNKVLTFNELTTEQKKAASSFYSLPKQIQRALMVKFGSYHMNNGISHWEANKNMTMEYSRLSEADKAMIDSVNPRTTEMFVPTKLFMVTDATTMTGRVAEVIAPAWWRQYMKAAGKDINEGDVVIPDDFLTRFAFGVRIPTTGIHSAVPFKIVGFTNSSSNIIIAPEELVALHGSDFDVDSLFALRVELLEDPKAYKTLTELTDLDGNVIIKKGQRLGWPADHTFESFEEMMLAQGATENKIATKEFDRQLAILVKLRKELDKLQPEDKAEKTKVKNLQDLAHQAYIKTLQNKRNFSIQWILLREANRYDMMQPITFESVKEDFLTPDLKIWGPIKNTKVFDANGNLSEDFLKLLDDNVQDDGIVAKFREWGISRANASDIKLDLDNNKIILEEGLRKRILNDSSISVKLKLKVLRNVIDFESNRDLNNAKDNLMYYVENFAGVSLTGAFANFVKALAYIYYAAPEGAKFIDSNKKPIDIVIGDTTYNSIAIAENRKDGKKIWELLDTLINGAIDNVKEQVLSLLNATNNTGSTLCTMVSLGIPLATTVSLLRQPVIMLDANKIGTFDIEKSSGRITDIGRDIKVKLLANGITEEQLNKPVTVEELDAVLEYIGENEIVRWETLPIQHMITQFKTISVYRKVFPVAQQISKTATALNIIRDFPVTNEDIEGFKETVAELNRYSGMEKTSVFDITHIKESKRLFDITDNIRGQVLTQRSDLWKQALNKIFNTYLKTGNPSAEELDVLNEEFDLYTLSAVTSLDEQDIEWKKPVKITNNDKSFYLYGTDAWVHNFALKLKEMKNRYPENEFLKLLEPKISNNGTFKGREGDIRIYWNLGSVSQEPGRAAALQVAYSLLDEQFQIDLMKFSAISTGASFGFRSYATLIPANILAKASEHYNNILKAISIEGNLEKFQEHFIIPFILRNPSFVSSWEKIYKTTGRQLSKNHKEFANFMGGRDPKNYDSIVYFGDDVLDISKVNKEGEEYKVFKKTAIPPLFFINKGQYNALMYRVDMDETANVAYYVKVTNMYGSSVYKHYASKPDLLTKPYSIKEAFANKGSIVTVEESVFNQDSIETTLNFIHESRKPNKGDVVLVKSNIDNYNEVLVPYKVESVSVGEKVEKGITSGTDAANNKVTNNYFVYNDVEIKLTKTKVSEQRTVSNNGTKLVKSLLSKLSRSLKMSYEIIDFTDNALVNELGLSPEIYGFFHNGKVYLNASKLNSETPIHEFGHGLLLLVKAHNKVLYNNLVRQIKDSLILNEIKQTYPDLSLEDQIDEAIVTAIGREGVNMTTGWTTALKDAIRRIYVSILKLINLYKPTSLEALSPNTTITELVTLMLSGNEILEATSDLTGTSELRYLNNKYTLNKQVGIEGDNGYTVVTTAGSKLLSRVTTFLEKFMPYKGKSLAESYTKRYFKRMNTPITGKVPHPTNDGLVINYDEALAHFEKVSERGRISGKYLHKLIQIYLTPQSSGNYTTLVNERDNLFNEYLKLGGNDYDFNWINGNPTYIKDLMDKLEITASDKIHSEFLVYNEKLDMGGTIDMLVEHSDGTFSIIDFKTGKAFDQNSGSEVMLHGARSKMLANSTNFYQLQLGTYAMLLKSLYPNARFRNIKLVNLNKNNTTVPTLEIDRSSVFTTLKTYFDNNPNSFITDNLYLLNHKEYTAISSSVSDRIDEELKNGAKNVFAARKLVLDRLYAQLDNLRRFGGRDKQPLTDKYIQSNPVIKRQLESLLLQISELEGSEFGNVLDTKQDMATYEAYTSVGFNVKNPLVKVFIKLRNQALYLIQQARIELFNESDSLLKPVLKEYYASNPLNKVGATVGVNMLSYEDVFKFMWDNSEENGRTIKTENSADWGRLTLAQKKYNVFYRESIRDMLFKTLSTKKGIKYYTDKLDNVDSDKLIGLFTKDELIRKYQEKIDMYSNMTPVEKWEAELGKHFVYTEDFTPRLPKLNDERDLVDSAKNLGNWALTKVTAYDVRPQDDYGLHRAGVPLKYITNYNAFSPNQTFHTELIMKMFAKNMLNKQYYDNVSAYGQTLALLFELKGEHVANLINSSKFLKGFIANNLHEIYDDELDVQGNKLAQKKIFGREISNERILRTVMSTVTISKLAFSVVGAGFNLGLNQIITIKDAVKGSIAKHIVGLEEDDLGFTLSDLTWAYGRYIQYLYNRAVGKEDKFRVFDKTFNIGQQEFIGASNKQMLTVAKNRAMDDRWFYLTYGIGDQFANSLIFLAWMKHKKVKTGKGADNSFWDSYEVKNGKLVWNGGVRGVTESGEIVEGLTSQELIKVKKITARLLGEYDQDFKRLMESNAFLAIFLQFKKYLPNKLENAYQGIWTGDFENASLGKYIEVIDHDNGKVVDVDGNPLLRWESAIDRGMSVVTAKVIKDDVIMRAYRNIARLFYLGKAVENDLNDNASTWSTLSPEQKQHVITQLLNLVVAASIIALVIGTYGDADDDDKDMLKRKLIDLSRDLSIEFNPLELLNMAHRPTVIIPTLLEGVQGVNKLMFNDGGLTRDGSIPGLKGVLNLLPLPMSAYDQIIRDPFYKYF